MRHRENSSENSVAFRGSVAGDRAVEAPEQARRPRIGRSDGLERQGRSSQMIQRDEPVRREPALHFRVLQIEGTARGGNLPHYFRWHVHEPLAQVFG